MIGSFVIRKLLSIGPRGTACLLGALRNTKNEPAKEGGYELRIPMEQARQTRTIKDWNFIRELILPCLDRRITAGEL
jgi:hypothetical protein